MKFNELYEEKTIIGSGSFFAQSKKTLKQMIKDLNKSSKDGNANKDKTKTAIKHLKLALENIV